MSNELLQKVVDTVLVSAGGGGLLNAEQADRFIDYMWDETTLSKEAREIRLRADTRDIDRINLGTRIARKATEGVDDSENAKPTFTKITVTTSKLRLDWELTTESLEDNIAGDDLEDHVARMMATQFGNDLEDLAINGDTSSSDPLLSTFDGYRKLGKNAADAAWVQADTASDGLTKEVFNQALKEMPRKYLARKGDLKFYTSAGLIQDFLNNLANRETDLGDNVWFGGPPSGISGSGGPTGIRPYGVQLVEVPLQSEDYAAGGDDPDAGGGHGYVELTFPSNRIWATKREVKVYRDFKPKKDSVEFTVFVRFGVQMDNTESYVGVYDVQGQ